MPSDPNVLRRLDHAMRHGLLEKEDVRRMLDGQQPASVDGGDWREFCKSLGQMSDLPPQFVIDQLVPKKALTLIPAPSYNCKTWFSVAMGKASYTGETLFASEDFEGFKVKEQVPVIYHVPEMNESLFRHYMVTVGVKESEDFLVRPMELGLWSLNEARMLKSAKGRLVVLDTAGYFNPADDASSYQQSLKFATLIHNLMVAGEAVAVVGLYHPPKASKEDTSWTLENSVLGSAGYGGILRSCLRMANLRRDLNDKDVLVYVQGLKNPGLKPFQLEGPMPLKMKVPPGKSAYLAELLLDDDDHRKACDLFKEGKSTREVAAAMGVNQTKAARHRKRWMAEQGPEMKSKDQQADIPFGEEGGV